MWIRIEMALLDPDPGQSKWCPKMETNLRFHLKRALAILQKVYCNGFY